MPHIIAGLLTPEEGNVTLLGSPGRHPRDAVPHRVPGAGQPLYDGFTVAEMLRFGARMNPRWDQEVTTTRVLRRPV